MEIRKLLQGTSLAEVMVDQKQNKTNDLVSSFEPKSELRISGRVCGVVGVCVNRLWQVI
jgi:hypothetical protein